MGFQAATPRGRSFCPPYPKDTPEALPEGFMGRVKAIHDRFGIPYADKDVRAWADTLR